MAVILARLLDPNSSLTQISYKCSHQRMFRTYQLTGVLPIVARSVFSPHLRLSFAPKKGHGPFAHRS
jgi:hypothetical protein